MSNMQESTLLLWICSMVVILVLCVAMVPFMYSSKAGNAVGKSSFIDEENLRIAKTLLLDPAFSPIIPPAQHSAAENNTLEYQNTIVDRLEDFYAMQGHEINRLYFVQQAVHTLESSIKHGHCNATCFTLLSQAEYELAHYSSVTYYGRLALGKSLTARIMQQSASTNASLTTLNCLEDKPALISTDQQHQLLHLITSSYIALYHFKLAVPFLQQLLRFECEARARSYLTPVLFLQLVAHQHQQNESTIVELLWQHPYASQVDVFCEQQEEDAKLCQLFISLKAMAAVKAVEVVEKKVEVEVDIEAETETNAEDVVNLEDEMNKESNTSAVEEISLKAGELPSELVVEEEKDNQLNTLEVVEADSNKAVQEDIVVPIENKEKALDVDESTAVQSESVAEDKEADLLVNVPTTTAEPDLLQTSTESSENSVKASAGATEATNEDVIDQSPANMELRQDEDHSSLPSAEVLEKETGESIPMKSTETIPAAEVVSNEEYHTESAPVAEVASINNNSLASSNVTSSTEQKPAKPSLTPAQETLYKQLQPYYNLATAYVNQGNAVQALKQLNKVIKRIPHHQAALWLRAQVYINTNEMDNGLKDLLILRDTATAVGDKSSQAVLNATNESAEGTGNSTANATSVVLPQVVNRKEVTDMLQQLIDYFFQSKQFSKVISTYAIIEADIPRTLSMAIVVCDSYWDMKDIPAAIHTLDKFQQEHDNHSMPINQYMKSQLYQRYMKLYEASQDVEQAVKYYQLAIVEGMIPSSALADFYTRSGLTSRSISMYEELLKELQEQYDALLAKNTAASIKSIAAKNLQRQIGTVYKKLGDIYVKQSSNVIDDITNTEEEVQEHRRKARQYYEEAMRYGVDDNEIRKYFAHQSPVHSVTNSSANESSEIRSDLIVEGNIDNPEVPPNSKQSEESSAQVNHHIVLSPHRWVVRHITNSSPFDSKASTGGAAATMKSSGLSSSGNKKSQQDSAAELQTFLGQFDGQGAEEDAGVMMSAFEQQLFQQEEHQAQQLMEEETLKKAFLERNRVFDSDESL